MKKDTVYTMRMNKRVREALGQAAVKERRTVASLLDKIITDYLVSERFLSDREIGAERREYSRKKVAMPVRTFMTTESEDESFWGVIKDISKGGVLVTYQKGSAFKFTSKGELPRFGVCLDLAQEEQELCFDCETRHISDTKNGIQIGAAFSSPDVRLLKRMETHLM